MTRRFDGRVALVTGSSKGIGLATATQLAREGALVAINARDAQTLSAAEQGLRGEGLDVVAIPGNVTKPDGAERLVATLAEAAGRPVDIIVNAVGVSATYGPLLEVEHDAFIATMSRNTWATVALAQAAIRHGMSGGGAIVAISTIGARGIQPLLAPYCASKAALESLVRHLARELGPRGIRVNAVAPGLVATDMSRALWEGEQAQPEADLLPLGRLGRPEDIADAITWLLSPGASWTTGQTIDVDGGRMLIGDEPAHLMGVHARPEVDRVASRTS
jgi:NAD(P)-dependent dehydrogenase (short-subunit alcohol dehydrogenase family)